MTLIGAPERIARPLAMRGRRFGATIAAWVTALVRRPRIALPALGFVVERHRLWIGCVAALFVAIESMGWGFDTAAIKMAARLPAGIVDAFNAITDYGRSSWTLWPSGVLILVTAAAASGAVTRMSRLVLASLAVRFGFVFFAVGIPGLFVTVVKRWIGRVRPSDAGAFAYHPFSWDSDYASLPSGHTAAAFSALVAFGALFPRARPALWIYAVTIGLSRVIIAAHFPSDVIVGAMVGACGAILVREWFAARRLGFYLGGDGKVHAMPGPSFRRIKKVAQALAAQ